jgi:hypothetical protein
MATLAEHIEKQLKMFHQFGIPKHFDLASRVLRLEETIPNFPEIFHSAKQAHYAGLTRLKRYADATIERALDNIEIGQHFLDGQELSYPYGIIRVYLKPPKEKMPEAVWKYDVINNGISIRRMGVNLHVQNGQLIATVSNIHGIKNKIMPKPENPDESNWAVEAVKVILENLPGEVSIVRGVSSCAHPSRLRDGYDIHRASNLYDRTFRNPRLNMIPIRGENGKVIYYETQRT